MEKYSAEIDLDAIGYVKEVKLVGEKSNLWQKIIEINMARLQLPNRSLEMEEGN
jgi:hypothetical protein